MNGFKCICPAGYTGPLCQTDIDDCQADNPCLNGGSCADLVNSFRCICKAGFTGSLCQTNVDDCLTKPCSNGGVCQDLVNDYRCVCKPGFTGKDCSVEINECTATSCFNGGTCVDRVNGFQCKCPAQFVGSRCERERNASSSSSHVVGRAALLSDSTSGDQSLSGAQIAVIATTSVAVPLVAILSCIVIVCLKQRRRKEQMRSDEEARRQNEQNVVQSITKKMERMDKCLEEHRIVNTLDFPKGKAFYEADLPPKDSALHQHFSAKSANVDACEKKLDYKLDPVYEKPDVVCSSR